MLKERSPRQPPPLPSGHPSAHPFGHASGALVRCHRCQRLWPVEARLCPRDGIPLGGATVVDATVMEPTTLAPEAGPPPDEVSPRPSFTAPLRAGDPDEIVPGMPIGGYEVERLLGEGATGIVLGARDPVIGKRVALKVLRRSLGSTRFLTALFLREARAVNRIGHPHIVDIFGLGRLGDLRPYLVMEWLIGETLGQRLARGPLPVVEVAQILEPVCRALEAAHDRGIVHRDLKPENLFLTRPDAHGAPYPKLLNFGVAKLFDSAEPNLVRTETGALVGTPSVSAPSKFSLER